MRARQFRKPRRPRKIFLVICEGETERDYVEALKRQFRIPVVIKTRISGNTLTPRLVRQYINELNVGCEDEYTVFFVYDADVQVVTERLKSLPGKAILSNPCIELWFLLHVKDHSRYVDAEDVVKLLRNSNPLWSNYSKGVLDSRHLQALMQNVQAASDRAKRLDPSKNPSSNIYEFIDILESQKR